MATSAYSASNGASRRKKSQAKNNFNIQTSNGHAHRKSVTVRKHLSALQKWKRYAATHTWFIPLIMTLFILGLSATPAHADSVCTPTSITLRDAYAGWQLLVSDHDRHVTPDATFASDNPAIALVDSHGYVTPRGNGPGVITVSRRSRTRS